VERELPEEVLVVPLDAVLFEQVLLNLLDNACKYSPAGSPCSCAHARPKVRSCSRSPTAAAESPKVISSVCSSVSTAPRTVNAPEARDWASRSAARSRERTVVRFARASVTVAVRASRSGCRSERRSVGRDGSACNPWRGEPARARGRGRAAGYGVSRSEPRRERLSRRARAHRRARSLDGGAIRARSRAARSRASGCRRARGACVGLRAWCVAPVRSWWYPRAWPRAAQGGGARRGRGRLLGQALRRAAS
jgi:hypothetical protein